MSKESLLRTNARRSGRIPNKQPSTPLTVLIRRPDAPPGPFQVRFSASEKLEKGSEKRDDQRTEEMEILADLIIDCYLAWKRQ